MNYPVEILGVLYQFHLELTASLLLSLTKNNQPFRRDRCEGVVAFANPEEILRVSQLARG
jgi:hypothetical protein